MQRLNKNQKILPHFAGPGLTSCGSNASQSPYPGRQNFLIAAYAASIQPERYVPCAPKILKNSPYL
jgi:hypothetical protein